MEYKLFVPTGKNKKKVYQPIKKEKKVKVKVDQIKEEVEEEDVDKELEVNEEKDLVEQ